MGFLDSISEYLGDHRSMPARWIFVCISIRDGRSIYPIYKESRCNSITFSIAVREKRFHPKLSPRIASVHRNDIAWILCVLFPEENSFSSSSRLPSVRDRMGISDRDWIRLSVLP